MSLLKKIDNYIHNPQVFGTVFLTNFCHWVPDRPYLKLLWRINMGYTLNLDNPTTFNEKLQWLRLYGYKPEYALLVDKYRVKEHVSELIGEEYVIKALGVWDRAEDIDFNSLPNQFVIKCNHDCGGMVICREKSALDIDEARKKINKCLNTDYSYGGRDKPYRNVRRLIFAEEYKEDSTYKELRDYKFFCFDGEVKAMFVASDRQRQKEPYFDFFDENYNHLSIKQGHPNAPIPPEKPKCFDEMKRLASVLSNGIPHVRIDFYEVDGRVYFGEFTFYHFGGLVPFVPKEWDKTFGDWINLPLQR